MCGRFYVDEEVWREIYRIAEASGRGQSLQKHAGLGTGGRRDVFPSSQAMVIRGVQKRAEVQNMKWGYEIPGLKKLLINARSETVREKRLFGQDFACRRCLIPAKGFYEWKRSGSGSGKTKYRFHDGSGILYLAGIYRMSEQGEEFTILTRAAEGCMEGIHSRMPLLIDAGSIDAWLFAEGEAEKLLHASLPGLERERAEEEGKEQDGGYEQLSLF